MVKKDYKVLLPMDLYFSHHFPLLGEFVASKKAKASKMTSSKIYEKIPRVKILHYNVELKALMM